MITRYGGEEFAILLPDTDLRGATIFCEKLRSAVVSYPWHEIHDGLRVTLSIGINDDLALGNFEKMMDVADACLYQAKHSGRNKVVSALNT